MSAWESRYRSRTVGNVDPVAGEQLTAGLRIAEGTGLGGRRAVGPEPQVRVQGRRYQRDMGPSVVRRRGMAFCLVARVLGGPGDARTPAAVKAWDDEVTGAVAQVNDVVALELGADTVRTCSEA